MAQTSFVPAQGDDLEEPGDDNDETEEESPQPGVVVSTQDTSWGGAGYHRFVTVENISSHALSWMDSTEHGGSTVDDWHGYCAQQGNVVTCQVENLQPGTSVTFGYGVHY